MKYLPPQGKHLVTIVLVGGLLEVALGLTLLGLHTSRFAHGFGWLLLGCGCIALLCQVFMRRTVRRRNTIGPGVADAQP